MNRKRNSGQDLPRLRYTKVEKEALRKLAEHLFLYKEGEVESSIFHDAHNLPLSYYSELAHPSLNIPSERETLLKEIYSSKTPKECNMQDCKNTSYGFSEVLAHVRENHSSNVYKHICVDSTCLTPFYKTGNANRHFNKLHCEEDTRPKRSRRIAKRTSELAGPPKKRIRKRRRDDDSLSEVHKAAKILCSLKHAKE